MKLEIISPDRTIFSGDVESVTLPGSKGNFTVLPLHAALISSLKSGEISYSVNEKATTLKISSGFVEVKNDVISVCVEKVIE